MAGEQGTIEAVGSPVLIAADPIDAAVPWRWTTVVIATAAAVLLLLNAASLGGWYDELTPGPLTEPLRAPMVRLTGWAHAYGLDRPRDRLRGVWEHARAARFGREQPGEQGEAAADAG